jgi:hypothetical protein
MFLECLVVRYSQFPVYGTLGGKWALLMSCFLRTIYSSGKQVVLFSSQASLWPFTYNKENRTTRKVTCSCFFASENQAVDRLGSFALSVGSTSAMEIEDDANSMLMVTCKTCFLTHSSWNIFS